MAERVVRDSAVPPGKSVGSHHGGSHSRAVLPLARG